MPDVQGNGDAFKPRLGWQDSRAWGLILILGYVVLAGLPVVLARIARLGSDQPFLAELGLGAALLGFSLLTLQVCLAGRFKTVDRPFGLDRVMRFHKAMAIVAGVLLLSHPLLLSAGLGQWRLFSLSTSWQVYLGKVALLLLMLGIVYALLVRTWRLEYQTWRRIHTGMIVVVALAFLHSTLLGPDLAKPVLRAYWFVLFGLALLVF